MIRREAKQLFLMCDNQLHDLSIDQLACYLTDGTPHRKFASGVMLDSRGVSKQYMYMKWEYIYHTGV